jgi:hypothetical protein
MAEIGLAASIIAVAQLTGQCLKTIRKRRGGAEVGKVYTSYGESVRLNHVHYDADRCPSDLFSVVRSILHFTARNYGEEVASTAR